MKALPNSTNINLLLSREVLRAVDDYRFKNRIGTRTEALRSLVAWGLVATNTVLPAEGVEATPAFNAATPVIQDGAITAWTSSL
jgi:hypothetical protein